MDYTGHCRQEICEFAYVGRYVGVGDVCMGCVCADAFEVR